MSTDKPDSLAIDGRGTLVAIVAARYNFDLVNALLESVRGTLVSSGVLPDDIDILRVPGSNEVPHAAALAAKTGEYDVVIGLGVIIEGDTRHDEILAHAAAHALQTASLQYEVPIINGILTVRNLKQAEDRITGSLQRGSEFAHAALEMAKLNRELVERILDVEKDRDLADMQLAMEKMDDWLDDDFDDEEDEDSLK